MIDEPSFDQDGFVSGERARRIDYVVNVANPLPKALHHYLSELVWTIEQTGCSIKIEKSYPSIERLGRIGRVLVTLKVMSQWFKHRTNRGLTLYTWPVFGLFDLVILGFVSGKNRSAVVIHDVTPLSSTFGHGAIAKFLVRNLPVRLCPRVICHSEAAARELADLSVAAVLLPHPIRPAAEIPYECQELAAERETYRNVLVLGQYKATRSISALLDIASTKGTVPFVVFQIVGDGWPEVTGWEVRSEFIEEEEFAHLLKAAACVVIPYDRFYQSGVAIRCAEAGTPIVASDHPQIRQLYGPDWIGIAKNDHDWGAAVVRVLKAEGILVAPALKLALDRGVGVWRDTFREEFGLS